MDPQLESKLSDWENQITKLRHKEQMFLSLEANEKAVYSKLFLQNKGTIPEREALAYATEEWHDFSNGLAVAKSEYHHERRMLDLKIKVYEATYLSVRNDHDFVRKN